MGPGPSDLSPVWSALVSPAQKSKLLRFAAITALIIGGEAVFGLPFHVARYFRPTLLQVFDLSNTDLGLLFSGYGLLAMICYVPGGPLADRFSARRLMVISLLLTGSMGFYMATIPDVTGLAVVYGVFGITTVLLFWAAMIRATRELGGSGDQGKAFGILDGGRGGVAAGLALVAQIPFAMAFGDDPTNVTDAQRVEALRNVIYVYTAATMLAALVVWFLVPRSSRATERASSHFDPKQIGRAFTNPTIWLQALIVICAYTAYKSVDNYSLFAYDAYGMNEVEAAQLAGSTAWVRLFAAFGAGLLADRIDASRAAAACFALLIVGYVTFGLTEPDPDAPMMLWLNVIVTCTAIFGLRGVYFALMEEVSIPAAMTGTAVGLISFVGFTPDIFTGPLFGWILDTYPGVKGHQYLFLLLAGFAAVGLGASLVLRLVCARTRSA